MGEACRNGHGWTAANTYMRPDGRRTCRECAAARVRDYKRTDKGRAANDRYDLSAGGAETARRWQKRYSQSEGGRDAKRRYESSLNGFFSRQQRHLRARMTAHASQMEALLNG